jgi:CheY-like chemotaxis protein
LLHDLLTHWQMSATSVDGGQAALTALAQAKAAGRPFRLVLLDAQMPEMDGFAVSACIQQDPSVAGATILMLSSMDLSGAAARCRALGIPFYLTKPIIPSDRWEAILTALGQAAPAKHPRPSAAQRMALGSRRSVRILVAEDNVVNQLLIPGSRGSGRVRGFLIRQGSSLCRPTDIRYDDTSGKTCRRGASWQLRFIRSVPWPICLWCWG